MLPTKQEPFRFLFFFSKEFSGTINAKYNMRTKCNKLFFDKFTLIWNSGFRWFFSSSSPHTQNVLTMPKNRQNLGVSYTKKIR